MVVTTDKYILTYVDVMKDWYRALFKMFVNRSGLKKLLQWWTLDSIVESLSRWADITSMWMHSSEITMHDILRRRQNFNPLTFSPRTVWTKNISVQHEKTCCPCVCVITHRCWQQEDSVVLNCNYDKVIITEQRSSHCLLLPWLENQGIMQKSCSWASCMVLNEHPALQILTLTLT